MKIKDLVEVVSKHLGKAATILIVDRARHDHVYDEGILKITTDESFESSTRAGMQLREIRNSALANNKVEIVLANYPDKYEFSRLTNEADAVIVISSFEHIDVAVVTKLRSVKPLDVRVFELEYTPRKLKW